MDLPENTTVQALSLIGELALDLVGKPSLEELAERALKLAVDIVPGCEQAGISLQRDGEVRTVASTGELAAQLDALEARLNEGPCVSALREAELVRIDDLCTETRWPRFCAEAGPAGLASLLACSLPSRRGELAAFNLYSTRTFAFTEASELVALAYAASVGVTLAAFDREQNLLKAMQTRETIGQAIGILVERHRITATQAFDLMVAASQRTHVKLRELADELVATGALPSVH